MSLSLPLFSWVYGADSHRQTERHLQLVTRGTPSKAKLVISHSSLSTNADERFQHVPATTHPLLLDMAADYSMELVWRICGFFAWWNGGMGGSFSLLRSFFEVMIAWRYFSAVGSKSWRGTRDGTEITAIT
jgi:hypothetical protein